MGIKRILRKDQSTEAKIKAAAKKLFTQNGFSATRTRDIAEEAGINLALLNYYFRSKEKLFDIVMRENVSLFLDSIIEKLQANPQLHFEAKLEMLISSYIEMLIENPDLPVFILNIIQNREFEHQDPSDHLQQSMQQLRQTFFKEITENIQSGRIAPVHPLHVIANIMGMVVFPFAAAPLLKMRTGLSDEQFKSLMLERKQLIPHWIKGMFMMEGIRSKE